VASAIFIIYPSKSEVDNQNVSMMLQQKIIKNKIFILSVISNAAKSFDVLANSLSVLYILIVQQNYF